MDWTFKIINDWGTIWSDKHQKQWLLHMESGFNSHVFFHHALVKAWTDTYLPLRNISPLFVWAEHKNGNRVFLPLILWKKNWKGAFLNSIVPAGYSDFDYHDPIFSNSPNHEELSSFWENLPLYLNRYSNYDEIIIDGVHQGYMPNGWEIISEEHCPFINISNFQSIDDYLKTRSKKMRYNLRRQEKIASEMAQLSFTTFSNKTVNLALRDLPLLLDYHKDRWPNAYKAPLFHENLIKEGLKSNILHFTRLDFNESPGSWRIGFYFRGIYYSYMPTINPQHMEYGLGKLHLLHCVNYAINQHGNTYDQLRGSELYKSEWTQDEESISSIRLSRSSFVSKIKMKIIYFKSIIK